MKNLLRTLTLLAILYANQAHANDTLIKFGQNLAGAAQWKYLGGGTNLDALSWKALAYAEPGWLTGTSALGAGTSNLTNTVLPGNTTAGGFGATGARYPTLYFRKKVNIANPSGYVNFKLSSKFDDGIVVWINGTEAYRNNVGTGTVNYNTWATTAITNNGADIYTINLNSSLFLAGDNIIAVEVHQATAASSDLYFDMELIAMDGAANVTRGPYLQMGGQNSITLRWRTDAPTNSRVEWGPAFNNYTNLVDSASVTLEHIVTISGLTADTKYFYRIGSSGTVHQQATNNYFVTLPTTGTNRKVRIAAFGDCGANNANQTNTKNALLSYLGSNNLDALITIGDNAYSSGTDVQFQTGFFDRYQNDILRFTKLYTGLGNHDYGNSSANTGVRNNAYYTNFTMPTLGELGGVPSGTEAYYSFNVGDVHFIALDSYGMENSNTTKLYDTLGAQAVWLKNDLTANTKRWTVAYFHHPPYTKTSHNSDTEVDLQAIREKFIRILERYGVDIVLCGHAHGFERTSLLRNYYTSTGTLPGLLDANFNANLHSANTSTGLYNGSANSCAYTYNSGKYNHGSIYVVSGSAGQIGGSAAGYPLNSAIYSNNANGGSFLMEADSNRLTARFISYDALTLAPLVRDSFTIFKDVNKVTNLVVGQNDPVTLAASWKGTYNWPNNGGANTQTVQPSTAIVGTFNYIVTDANNCLKDSFNIVVTSVAPVVLKNFTATLQKEKVLLDWATSQELNNDYFTIAKSTDGVVFQNFESVDAAMNSTITNTYQITDYQPFEGVNFYRLSQTDQSGYTKQLGTKRVTYNNGKDFSATAIHTGNGNIKILFNSKIASDISIKVFDVLGKEMYSTKVDVPQGAFQKNIQLSNGVFVLKMSTRNQNISQKIVVE